MDGVQRADGYGLNSGSALEYFVFDDDQVYRQQETPCVRLELRPHAPNSTNQFSEGDGGGAQIRVGAKVVLECFRLSFW